MGHDETFRSYLLKGFQLYGNHFGSSRSNSLRLAIYEETERQLASWIGSKSALMVSSGMWAGQLVMKTIEDLIARTGNPANIHYHYAPKVHPALWGNHYSKSDSSWSEWAHLTVQKVNESLADTAHIICTDGVGSPMVEAFDFSIFANLPGNRSNIWIIVDESHTLGVCGKQASGFYRSIENLRLANVIAVSSLNKALGIPGGLICCDEVTRDWISRSPWFAGASPPAPAYIYALKKLLETGYYEEANAMLAANINYFHKRLTASNLFHSFPAYPVLCSKNPALFETLLTHGIMASCFSYPGPNDPPVTRLAISALHQKEDLDRLAEVCNNYI